MGMVGFMSRISQAREVGAKGSSWGHSLCQAVELAEPGVNPHFFHRLNRLLALRAHLNLVLSSYPWEGMASAHRHLATSICREKPRILVGREGEDEMKSRRNKKNEQK